MVEKKRSPKKKGREEKGGKGEPKGTGNGKHSEQERAEQEDKRTFQERNSGGEAQAENPSRKRTGKGRFPIVGIGASAGGLQALEAFFDALPADSGLAFVVITHTDPEHESLLPELLKKKAKIPVKLIQEALAAKPDTVYLPPSNRDLILKQRKFHLEKRPAKYGIHMPVDLFFKHLAEDVGDLAAGVILSGTGTDGTQGLRLIKEKAGVAVAQDPNSARHGGMPGSAIETGLVDYVLPPWEIPQCLIQYFKHPAAIQYKHADKDQKTPDPLRRILTLLANRTRHDFSLYKENTLIRRIERRMTVTRSRNALDYLKTLHEDPKEVRALFQDLLIGVTNFFRDPETFAYLKQEVLPGLISGKEDGALRVWVPGCATGEEAYSVAIILQECLEEKESYRQFQVFGTDIDSHAIEKARHASYIQNIVSDVSPERLNRFFTREDSMYRVKSDIREKVVFAEQNLLADPPFSKLDLLVCRNLLIYLKLEAQNRLIPLFHYALRDGGILFLGTSEGVGPHHDFFEQVSKHYNIFRKKNHLIHPQLQFPTASRKLEGSTQKQEADKEPEKLGPSLGRTVDKVLMEEHTPACVVVNQRGEILHFHGHTGKYLEPAPGAPTLQIADMAREGLRFVLLSALRRVNEENPEIREKGVKVKTNHEFQRIDLVVKRLNEPPLKNCRMVIFEELPQPAEIEQRPESRRPAQQDTRRVPELERELMRLRQDYRGAILERGA
ncbi:MAG: CheR family methyltransferase [Deltaproteobacteria bacterium]